jgi:hypothetical protein
MTAYLIDATFGYLSWVILILLAWGLIKLIKKEKLKTINFKTVFLASLIGVVSPTVNLVSGKYQTKQGNEVSLEMSESDKSSLKTIIQSCLSGQEIDKETHSAFYSIVDKYKMSQKDIDEMFSLFYNEDLSLLQKSFYEDALKTIQNGQISESKIRLELQEKYLNESQKERNSEYLKKVLAKEPIDINGEPVILDEEICNTIIENIEEIFSIGKQNINTLKNREAYN